MATTTLRLTAAVRSHGGAQPLLSGDIAMDGLQLDQIKVEPQIAAYRTSLPSNLPVGLPRGDQATLWGSATIAPSFLPRRLCGPTCRAHRA